MVKINPEFARYAMKVYGVQAQLGTFVEECDEFSKEFMKYLFRPSKDVHWDNMEQEFADVLIMTEQLSVIFDMDRVDEVKRKKLRRLVKRLEKSGHEPPIPYIEE